jgi:hypothetical protein
MIPVPFPHEDDALEEPRDARRAMDHLGRAGDRALSLGRRGLVGDLFGPAIEAEWNPFTAKMIQRSGARVVPIYFPGQNSRWYQIANQISATLRQGLLLHEVVHALNKPQRPDRRRADRPDAIESWSGNPRGFIGCAMAARRSGLTPRWEIAKGRARPQRVGTGASPR